MTGLFGPVYAASYDALYQDKDYDAECDLIESIFRVYAPGEVRSILDLGCGTGNHALPLARRGYDVVGVDRAAEMLVHARDKAARSAPAAKVVYLEGDVRGVELSRHFDATVLMFSVLGYQLTNADVLSTLRTARRHLRHGGLVLFDVWYGPAVLHQRPSQRVRTVSTAEGQILRVVSGELDARRQLCTVAYQLWRFEGDRLVANTKETHTIRYFFPLELELMLECTGFAVMRLGAFPDLDREPDEQTWSILGVARAI